MGNHQIKIDAVIQKRKPINKKGGKYSKAGLAITKPKPKVTGTRIAITISRKLKFYSLQYKWRALVNYFIGICFFGS
jgi:hypothetical protein